ncbi:MAG: hypothetical protein VZS44_10885 [Bacilli bacterium]|nr:hypothetical protein [Bacilli bacterium]
MIDEYKYVKKTPETRDELIKIQTERLKVLNKEVRELKAEQKRTYKEMVYFRNKSRLANRELKKLKEMMDNAMEVRETKSMGTF